MCGICGQFAFGDDTAIDKRSIRAMMNRMVHRGPDDEGFYLSGSLGLGFRRLSIIDIEGGHQPMSDAEKSVWVVFNGEIYNFQELREELQSYGHVFRSRCDTEVIVHGYKQWGNDVLQHLNGMFGLAIWDEAQRQLMVARDPLGIKPIYYTLSSKRLTFASEIRPLLACLPGEPEIDPVAVALFLRYRYTPSPATVIKGIKKLAPGTRVVVRHGGEAVVERWWNFTPEPFDRMPTDAEAQEQLLALYRRAVRRQLVSDVPVGLLLSGGIDSGLLLALMNEIGPRNTYTVGYGATFKDDELVTARRTAEILNAPNASIEISKSDFEKGLPEIVARVEEPIATSSIVPMYHVCKRAREDVKVVFIGQGPDELFGGYKRHLGVRYGGYWRSLPKFIREPWTRTTKHVRSEWFRRGLYSLGAQDRIDRYQKVFSIIPGDLVSGLFRPDVLQPDAVDCSEELWKDLEPLMSRTDELGGFQFLEVRSSLPDELLMFADKMSMAHGLEVRVPYLDQEIVEYVERLDASFKVRRGSRKWLHRKVCKQYLPHEVFQRKKAGFAVNVVDDWFRHSLSSELDDVLLCRESNIYNFLEPGVVVSMLEAHRNGSQDNHKLLFSLVALEHSLRSYRF